VKFGGGDGDLCTEVRVAASISMAAATSARTGPPKVKHRKDSLHLIAKCDPHLEVTFHFHVNDLVLVVGGHPRKGTETGPEDEKVSAEA
jgi:hypothetical protein